MSSKLYEGTAGFDRREILGRVRAVATGDYTRAERRLMGAIMDSLESLRLAYVYALKDSHPEELGENFKPHKWEGFEIEYAQRASRNYRELLDAMMEVTGID